MKYIDADKLIAKIERLKRGVELNREHYNNIPLESRNELDAYYAQELILNSLIDIIDTLPEQPAEGLEEAFEKEFAKFSNDPDVGDYALPIDLSDYKDFARHFAEWGAEHLKK